MEKNKKHSIVREFILVKHTDVRGGSGIADEVLRIGEELGEHGRFVMRYFERPDKIAVLAEAESEELCQKYMDGFEEFLSGNNFLYSDKEVSENKDIDKTEDKSEDKTEEKPEPANTSYKFFASVYDQMMDNINYENWKFYLLQLFYKYGVEPFDLVTELGCGTGMMTRLLAGDGFRMTGIDLSEDMLEVAQKKSTQNKNDSFKRKINYSHQDMRDFKLAEEQNAIISICDSMNYLTSVDDLYKTIKAARDNLKTGGVFIFDLKTEHFFIEELDGNEFSEDLGEVSCTWKNSYDRNARVHTYTLEFSNGEKEVHKQRVFGASDIKEAAQKAGFKRAAVYDAFSFDKPRKGSDRIYVVLKK